MKKILYVFFLCFIASTLSSCSFNLNDKELDKYIENYIMQNRKDANAAVKAQEVSKDATDNWEVYDGNYNESDYTVKYVKYESTGGLEELNNYGQCDDILYPGALIDISNPTLSVINLEQSPVTMSIDLVGIPKNNRPYIMSNPSLSEARNGVNKLVSNANKHIDRYPTKLSYSANSVKNSSELNIQLGVNACIKGIDIGAKFDYSTEATSTSLVLVLKQTYYTISIDVQKGASKYFRSDSNVDEIKRELDGKLPAVVSSVSYGRIAIIKLTSKESMSSIAGQLSGGYAKIVEVSAAIDQKIKNEEITSEVFVYGGSLSSDTTIGTTSNLTELITEFNKGLNPEAADAVPISYKFSYISDSSPAKIQMATDPIYVKQYVLKKTAYELSLENMTIQYNDVNDKGLLTEAYPTVKGFDISSYIYTTSLSSPDPTSTSFTGTFTSKSQYAFNDDKIEFTQNSLVIYNVDNEKLSKGDLMNIFISGKIYIYLDIESASWETTFKRLFKPVVDDPLASIAKDIQFTFDENSRMLTMNYTFTLTKYADIISSEGVVVDCSNGALTIRLKFDVNQL